MAAEAFAVISKARLEVLDKAERRTLREIRRAWDTVLSLSMRRERFECQARPADPALWLARIEATLREQRLVEGELSELERRLARIQAEIKRGESDEQGQDGATEVRAVPGDHDRGRRRDPVRARP